MKISRHSTRQINVGDVAIGGDASVSVQTMTKTDTRNVRATVTQIRELEELGCDIVRLAIPDMEAAKAFAKIRKHVRVPLVADIHFDYSLALEALKGGADGIRINPGNLGGPDKLKQVVEAARKWGVAIRVGVNSGSVEKDILRKYKGATPPALVESAVRNVQLIEDFGYDRIKISVKASDVARTVDAYRLLAKKTKYPLHLGVTEAGTFMAGTVRSSVAMGILLAEGIGDTIRVSLTDVPAKEVRVGLELLRSLGLREPGPSVISCPTCGRIQVDVVSLAGRVEEEMDKYFRQYPKTAKPIVAVMGCMVNGPGEAKDADIAVAGGNGKFALYLHGKQIKTVTEAQALKAIMDAVRKWRR
ncbi:MAG: flavodoxin-dependent (E)-4-hydroxy-3-methylbut-2-enyl-diphosphate synthase [Kiritimatiellae bacterium]|nr:flavodoxin-dependent (E)-4-hydroxy-3-methylbut-2-enyl-diphosphate synthase [Kiritimatiellia bacterium]MDD5521383.1 flavodoxin-dependent (E)-4-hydroxy-3-methylbut-2-enyl-diphosphate synthase [Kiritimatiellia bacterium]